MRPPGRPGTTAALLVGLAVAFVVGERLVRGIRPALLLDPDPRWLVPRLLLWVFLAAAVASAGGVAAAAFLSWSRSQMGRVVPGPLPLSRGVALLLCAAALFTGILLRFVWIESLPIPFFGDEVNLIGPSLALSGQWQDFADTIRPMPYGAPDAHEMIGVLYLRMFRESLRLFGTTILGVRFLSFAGGALSLVTATLLARALLPTGGAALAALVLAGLRWHIILSRFGWHSIVLAPLIDLATLLLVVARRRQRAGLAAVAGALLGVGAHFYLAAWIAGAALFGFCLWPEGSHDSARTRFRRVALYLAGFFAVAAPLFLFREGRTQGYFGRVSRHSVIAEVRYTQSLSPAFSVAADALVAPWFLPDPEAWHDLPGRSRLGWIVGIPVAVAFARALIFPHEALSRLLLLHAGAAFTAAVAGGQAGHPNGFRFGYLTTMTAVAAAGGCLQLIRLPRVAWRRAAGLAVIGMVTASGAAGARDALLRWPDNRATFDSFHGEDTLVGRAAARWERYGIVRVAAGLGRSDTNIDAVRRYRLSPGTQTFRAGLPPPIGGAPGRLRSFRIAPPGASPDREERVVERVRDGWTRDWAVVLGGTRPRK